VQLATRPYLLAGFTATSIVAAVSAVPNIATPLPGVESTQVRLLAADSQLNAKMRTFRTAEANVLASLVEHTATVVGDLDVRSRGAIAHRAAIPGIGAGVATSSNCDRIGTRQEPPRWRSQRRARSFSGVPRSLRPRPAAQGCGRVQS
jgi:hypothetical protein